MDLSDVEIFVDLVNSASNLSSDIDILIHSPGGDPAVAERICYCAQRPL